KRFGAVTALAGVNFEVGAGEVVALIGENGSGKSTLARILAGVLTPDRGQLRVDGSEVRFKGPEDALGHGVAIVTQELTAVPAMSLAENVLLGRMRPSLKRVRRRGLEEEAGRLLARVGIQRRPSERFSALRAGERELVEVAKALSSAPRLLILDEATSRLGEEAVGSLLAVVRRLREEGTSTVFITHRLREVLGLADRAVVLRDGEKVGELPGGQLDEARLSRMMVGRELKGFFGKRDLSPGEAVLEVDELLVAGAGSPVSLRVRAREVVGLAGLTGAGRTELLETIAGARRPLGGKVQVAGRPVRLGAVGAALRAGIALVPEDRRGQALVLDRSVAENAELSFYRPLQRLGRRSVSPDARLALERMGVTAGRFGAPVRTLSGGNQQKVVIGRCLSLQPRVLLLDEPTRGVDIGAKEEIFLIIGQMLEAGMAILFASSELPEVLGISDRVLVMHEGRLAGELDSGEATEERIAYLSTGGMSVV
ncbi:MAG: sugar ABC transporter ATP-binding protein, partial [Actinobacteria bacterium]|nr:sugar ABC transporter ATP-binding protein [Actinomycetota bacterium]